MWVNPSLGTLPSDAVHNFTSSSFPLNVMASTACFSVMNYRQNEPKACECSGRQIASLSHQCHALNLNGSSRPAYHTVQQARVTSCRSANLMKAHRHLGDGAQVDGLGDRVEVGHGHFVSAFGKGLLLGKVADQTIGIAHEVRIGRR